MSKNIKLKMRAALNKLNLKCKILFLFVECILFIITFPIWLIIFNRENLSNYREMLIESMTKSIDELEAYDKEK